MRPLIQNQWTGGVDNLTPADRVPKGFVRRAVNVDATPGGELHLRSGYEQVYAGNAVRGVLALGDKLLIADGPELIEFDPQTQGARVLRTIAGAGQFIGAVLNNTLYFQTANESLEYDGRRVRAWGVPDVLAQPLPAVTTGGALRAGIYRLAVTFTDADGREGGTDTPLLVTVPEGGALDVELPAPPEGGRVNLYLGYPNSQTLYLQGQGSAATPLRVTSLRDDTRTLTTARLRAPVIGSVICAHGSQLAIAQGRVVWLTAPMRPHLLDPLRGFLQFPAEVGELMSDQTTLYVSSDVSYSLSDVAGDTPSQREILNFPALRGSAVILPDERCAWMTRYGQAVSVGDGSGGLQLVNRQHYAPELTAQGAAGVIEHNGNQLIVTTTRGPQGANQLAATDFFIGEVVRP